MSENLRTQSQFEIECIFINFNTEKMQNPEANFISAAMSDIFQFVSRICGLIKITFN